MFNSTILSFNFSTAGDKQWFIDYNQPLQIMPQTVKIPTNESINKYPKCTGEYRESVIHTSYITKPFNNLMEGSKYKTFIYNIMQYIKLCKRLKYKRLLVHLPQTNKEMNNLSDGLIILSKIFNKVKDIILVLEIPSFKSGFKMDAYKYFEIIITNYFNKFVNNNVELCFDTAHLFANCVDSQDMIKLFESKINNKKLIDYCKIIHLNGNVNQMGKSDKHIQIFSPNNKMKDVDKLINYLKDKNKIFIAENTTSHANYKQWEEFANKYNIKIVDYISNISA